MKNRIKITLFLVAVTIITGCASKYDKLNPETMNYLSKSSDKNIILEYKYNTLEKNT